MPSAVALITKKPYNLRIMILRRRHLNRRTFLRGSGVTIALPWLDAMLPGLGAPTKKPTRSVFIYSPNGMKMDDWTPTQSGANYKLPFLLEPLAKHKSDFTVFSQIGIHAGQALGDGPGDHARAVATYLTCMHPRKTGGKDLRAGVSIDQVIAQHIGSETVLPSLELGMEGGRLGGICDSGYSCAYSNNVAWRSPADPVAKESNPRAAFTRIFGDANLDPATTNRSRRRLKSVLDAALADAKSLRGKLGTTDKQKLDGYLTSVRECELRLSKLEEDAAKVQLPKGFWDREDDTQFTGKLQIMYDLIMLAMQADQTRVITFMLGNGGNNRSYRFLDVPEGHHQLSHHRGDPKKLAKIRKINRYHTEQFAAFIGKLQKTTDGDSNLLQQSMVLYGSGLGDGNRHDHLNLPILLAGQANGQIKQGRHLKLPKGTPLANLYLRMLEVHGIKQRKFADSTRALNV
jgi:hypothetical protein